MTDGVAQDLLQSLVRRIENLDDEIKVLNDDKASVYKEAKADGFDVKVLRKLISDRRKDVSERMEFDEVYDLYAAALGMLPSSERGVVRAHVENIEKFDADGVITEGEGTGSASALSEAIQPETATRRVDDLGSVQDARKMSTDGQPAGGLSNPDSRTPGEENAGVTGGESAATPFPAYEAPTALSSEVVPFRAPKPLRPHCLNPEKCGGQGKKHCWSCESQIGETSTGGSAA